MYAIRKGSLYVARPGSISSYTNKLQEAQLFRTKEEAEANKCDNESVEKVMLGN